MKRVTISVDEKEWRGVKIRAMGLGLDIGSYLTKLHLGEGLGRVLAGAVPVENFSDEMVPKKDFDPVDDEIVKKGQENLERIRLELGEKSKRPELKKESLKILSDELKAASQDWRDYRKSMPKKGK